MSCVDRNLLELCRKTIANNEKSQSEGVISEGVLAAITDIKKFHAYVAQGMKGLGKNPF
jgi:hypothetical protein